VVGVESIEPTMTLVSENPDVTINLDYNKDINKVFNKLIQAIISLGGTI
jgi:hypothetical protein